jgi:hypothetical protein
MTDVPKSVQAQAERAEAMRSERYEPKEPAPVEPAPQPTETAKPVEKPKQEDETRDASYWQHRFEVLQGKYNSEVRELPVLRQRITDLERQLEQAKNSQAEPSQDVQSALMKGLPEGVVDEYGPDLIQTIATIVSNAQGGKSDSDELQSLRKQVERLTQDKAEDTEANFWADLNARVPEWKELQSSEAGQKWLLAYDQKTGRKRNDALTEAANNFHTQTVIRMFEDLKSVVNGSNRQPPPEAIQPETTRSTTQTPAGGKSYTSAEIKQFYRDRSQGAYAGKEDQATAIESDIFAAQREGRIRG